jgi:hypothetical protein
MNDSILLADSATVDRIWLASQENKDPLLISSTCFGEEGAMQEFEESIMSIHHVVEKSSWLNQLMSEGSMISGPFIEDLGRPGLGDSKMSNCSIEKSIWLDELGFEMPTMSGWNSHPVYTGGESHPQLSSGKLTGGDSRMHSATVTQISVPEIGTKKAEAK